MHELSVALAIHKACRTEIATRGGGRLRAVRVAIGEFAGVEPTLLSHAWPSVVAGTGDDDATLAIDWFAASQTCPKCGPVKERQAGSWLRLCPACNAPLQVQDASQLDIVTLDFDAAPACVPG